MDLTTGRHNWVFQATAGDAWNTACDTATPDNCPKENGPDFDFGAAVMLVADDTGTEYVIGGQKSGYVHALNPDTGQLIWQTQVGRGGIQGGVHFGLAADDNRIYVPISDMPDGREYSMQAKPGVHALDIRSGESLWYTPATNDCVGRNFCHSGISQAITVAADMVLAGGMDGIFQVLDSTTGRKLRHIDTKQSFSVVNGATSSGGSMGGAAAAVVQDGVLVLSSGYGIYNHMPGNLLLVLKAQK